MHKVTKGVYCLTSPSGKRYVGISVSETGIEERWRKYKKLDNSVKKQKALYNALKKYGPENFKYEVILETNDVDNAGRSEMYLIDVWNLQDSNYGYNIASGGLSGMYGRKHNESTKNIIKKKALDRKLINSGSFKLGHKDSDETRKKKSNSRKGYKAPIEVTKKRLETQRNNGLFPNRTIKNIKTLEVAQGTISELASKYNFNRSNMIVHKKTNGWILVELP